MAEVKTKQDIILDIAEALIDAGVIDTKKFKNKVEIVGKMSAIVDKHLDEYVLIKTEILSDAAVKAARSARHTVTAVSDMLTKSLT